jgi:hypothetical protein
MILYDTSSTSITSKEYEHNGTYLLSSTTVLLYSFILCIKWWGGPLVVERTTKLKPLGTRTHLTVRMAQCDSSHLTVRMAQCDSSPIPIF